MPVEIASFADAPWTDAAAPSLMVISAQASDGISLVAAFRIIHPTTGVAVLALNDRDEDFIAWASIGISGYVEPEASADASSPRSSASPMARSSTPIACPAYCSVISSAGPAWPGRKPGSSN